MLKLAVNTRSSLVNRNSKTPNLEAIVGEGKEKAFASFYEQYFAKLLLESNKYVKDIGIAEEIVQDLFVKIWERAVDFDEINSVKSYLYRSVINASINHINRQKNMEGHHQKILRQFTEDEVAELDEENELIVMLYEEIEKLPPKCREIFKLNRFERLKYREIAEKLAIAEKTVENHVGNALKLLREAMLAKKSSTSGLTHLKILRLLSFF
jgi:RNA polymerase sigma-70 factor (ECF subfamily)